MSFHAVLVAIATAIVLIDATSIKHDQVQPFTQPEPVTISEKAAVLFKPSLQIRRGCVSFAAVNAAGEISGGLKGTGGTGKCENSALGSQVYGRSTWHNDVWAIMYAWYFPKGFLMEHPSRRHDWASVVVWINNPALETPKVLGFSTSQSATTYNKLKPAKEMFISNGTTPKFYHSLKKLSGGAFMDYTIVDGDFQDLVMWDQLTDEARTALSTTDFGEAKVPFIDSEFSQRLENGSPF